MERNRIYKILDILCVLLLLATVIFTVVNWNNIGEVITTHINYKGEADGIGGKGSIIALICVAFITFAVTSIIEKFPNTWNIPIKVTEENRERVYACTKDMLKLSKLEVVGLMCVFVIGTVIGSNQLIFIGSIIGVIIIVLTVIWGLVRVVRSK